MDIGKNSVQDFGFLFFIFILVFIGIKFVGGDFKNYGYARFIQDLWSGSLIYIIIAAVVYMYWKYTKNDGMSDKNSTNSHCNGYCPENFNVISKTSVPTTKKWVADTTTTGLSVKPSHPPVSMVTMEDSMPGKEVTFYKNIEDTPQLIQTKTDNGGMVQILDNVANSDAILQDYTNKTNSFPQKTIIKDQNGNNVVYVKVNDDGTGTNIDYYNPPSFQVKAFDTPHIDRGILNDGTYARDNELTYTDFNLIPNKNVEADKRYFDPSYNILPPERWFPIPPRPPVCVSTSQCGVCPVIGNLSSMNEQYAPFASLGDWDASRRIMPPDNINTAFIRDKLNSGR